MHLVSLVQQHVRIPASDLTVSFRAASGSGPRALTNTPGPDRRHGRRRRLRHPRPVDRRRRALCADAFRRSSQLPTPNCPTPKLPNSQTPKLPTRLKVGSWDLESVHVGDSQSWPEVRCARASAWHHPGGGNRAPDRDRPASSSGRWFTRPASASPSRSSRTPPTAAIQFVVEQAGRIRVFNNGAVEGALFLNLTGVVLVWWRAWAARTRVRARLRDVGTLLREFHAPARWPHRRRALQALDESAGRRRVVAIRSRVVDGAAVHRAAVRQPQWRLPGIRAGRLPLRRLGDGGSGNDPNNNAQRTDQLLGKMLRIDVNVPDGRSARLHRPSWKPGIPRSPRSGVLVFATRGSSASTTCRAAEPARW